MLDRLRAHVANGRRVLVGFDFPYGYPAGLARSLGLDGGPPWRALWDRLDRSIEDDELNRNNRFAVASQLNRRIGGGPGPFWGCPQAQVTPHLKRRMNGVHAYPYATPSGPLERLRRTESAMNALPGIGRVRATWQLAGAGSVGGQALVGIPRVRRLRDHPDLERVSTVWPFETGFTAAPASGRGPFVLHAEIWPGIVPSAEVAAEQVAHGLIHDQAQVRLMCRWAERQDDLGALGAWFGATALDGLDREAAVEEEGWILGCPA